MAPSKTFNIAGIVTSYSIIPNAEIREKFYSFMEAGEFNAGTIFAYTGDRSCLHIRSRMVATNADVYHGKCPLRR